MTIEDNQYRKSPRAKWADYNEGEYFITVCTQGKEHYFGEIANGEMHLSVLGKYLEKELSNPEKHHPAIKVLCSVVMPNHFHAIVRVEDYQVTSQVTTHEDRLYLGVGTRRAALSHQRLPLLSTYVGCLKAAITRWAHAHDTPFAWQPRYHDHIIRGIKDGNSITEYIKNNVTKWSLDCYNDSK